MAKKATRKAAAKKPVEAEPETETLHVGGDGAHRTHEQHENHARRQALGY